MKAKLPFYMAALVLLLALGIGAGCSRGRSDAQIVSDIQSKLFSDSNIQSRQITVQSDKGVVTLSGTVSSDTERGAAATDAGQVEGVKTVVNNLTLAAPVVAQEAQPAVEAPPEEAPAPRHRARTPAPRTRRMPSSYNDSSSSAAPMSSGMGSSAASTPAAPPPPPPVKYVTIPAGTSLAIRLIDAIDSEKNQPGQSFRATLDSPLAVNGDVVVPAGWDVTGAIVDVKSAGRFAGRSILVLQLTQLGVNGKYYNLQTNQYSREGSSRGKSTATKVGVGAAAGAILGGLIGGGKGAAIGAAAGGGAGTAASAATKGQQILLPAETVLNFQLQGPLTVVPTTAGPNAGRQQLNN